MIVASGILPDVEGGILPPGKNARTAVMLEISSASAMRKLVPPGWKHRLYGRQDARRYNTVGAASL